MSKFERVLSTDEIANIVFPCDWSANKDQQIACIIAREIEQAVLAKLAEQEPVAWIDTDNLNEPAFVNDDDYTTIYKTKEHMLDEFRGNPNAKPIPLYANPMPSPSDESDKTACVSEKAESDTQNNGQVNLDSSNGGQAIPDGWQLVPKEPTPEMIQAATSSDEEYSKRSFGEGIHLCQGGYDHYLVMLAAAPTHKEAKE